MRRDRTGLRNNLAALNVVALRTPKQNADVVAGLALVQKLPEHLDARADRLLRVADAHKLDFLADLDHTTLDAPVTTVPRPEIEKTSSIGIRKGWSFGRSGCGM